MRTMELFTTAGTWHVSLTSVPQESPCTCLHKRIICPAQDALGVVERIDLAAACFLPHVMVLEQPIAFGMQRGDVPCEGQEFVPCLCLRLLQRDKLSFGVCQRGRFSGESVRICDSLGGRLGHHSHIVCLRVFLLR